MRKKLKQILAGRQPQRIMDTSRVASAVLLPLFKRQEDYYILFIKRTNTVKEHKGQISFPGGTREKGDKALLDTALRECFEEIGLCAEDAEILGRLDDEITTTSNFVVSTFVASIPWPYRFLLNKDEVDEIIEIPVSTLLDDNCFRHNKELLNGKPIDSYLYYYQGRIIWGATARILSRFLDIYNVATQSE